MNKSLRCLALLLAMTLFLVGCGRQPSPEPQVVSIEMSRLPDKIEYVLNEPFSMTGAQIKINFDDDSHTLMDVRPDMAGTVSTSTPGVITVTVFHAAGSGVFSTTFAITVLEGDDEIDDPVNPGDDPVIMFDSRGGNHVEPIVADVGQAVTPPSDPVREGYVFAGWYIDMDVLDPYVFDTMPASGITLFADWSSLGLTYTLNEEDDTYAVSSEDVKHLLHVEVPRRMDGRLVTEIASSGFANMSVMMSIVLPASIHTWNTGSFYNAGLLQHLHLSSRVEKILGNAFLHTYSLTSFSVDENNPFFQVIDDVLFSKNGETLVRYPSGKENVGTYTLPAHVKIIATFAFASCYDLTNIILNHGLTTINEHAFFDATGLEAIVIPDTVTTVGMYAFRMNMNLASVTLGSGLSGISTYMFSDCGSLKEIILPVNITTIGYGAFYGCHQLKRVIIQKPSSMGIIQGHLFMFQGTSSQLVIILPDQASVDDYGSATYWSSFKSRMQVASNDD